jgi:hypothetical protein
MSRELRNIILGVGLSWVFVPAALAVPDTIRAEGVPTVPAAVLQALNRYQNIRSASFQGWDTQGRGMYITTRFADVPQVHFVPEPGAARVQLTFGPERVGSVAPRPRHDQFLYSMDEGGPKTISFFCKMKRVVSRGG